MYLSVLFVCTTIVCLGIYIWEAQKDHTCTTEDYFDTTELVRIGQYENQRKLTDHVHYMFNPKYNESFTQTELEGKMQSAYGYIVNNSDTSKNVLNDWWKCPDGKIMEVHSFGKGALTENVNATSGEQLTPIFNHLVLLNTPSTVAPNGFGTLCVEVSPPSGGWFYCAGPTFGFGAMPESDDVDPDAVLIRRYYEWRFYTHGSWRDETNTSLLTLLDGCSLFIKDERF